MVIRQAENFNQPFWWDLNLGCETKELVDFDTFQSRIISLGNRGVYLDDHIETDELLMETDASIYVGEQVPVTVADLNLGDDITKCVVTARPYNEFEIRNFFTDVMEGRYHLDSFGGLQLINLLRGILAELSPIKLDDEIKFKFEDLFPLENFLEHVNSVKGDFPLKLPKEILSFIIMGNDDLPEEALQLFQAVKEHKLIYARYKDHITVNRNFPLAYHFLPHVRGRYVDMKDNFIFWDNGLSRISHEYFKKSMEAQGLSYIHPTMINPGCYETDYSIELGSGYPFYELRIQRKATSKKSTSRETPYQELVNQRLLNSRKPVVLSDAVLCDFQQFPEMLNEKARVLCLYPARLSNVTYPVTLVLSNSAADGGERRPVVLGAYAGYDELESKFKLWTFKQPLDEIKNSLKQSFDMNFELVSLSGKYRVS
jgi:hypothetical protein